MRSCGGLFAATAIVTRLAAQCDERLSRGRSRFFDSAPTSVLIPEFRNVLAAAGSFRDAASGELLAKLLTGAA